MDRLFLNEAHSHFSDLGIQIVCGQRYLGGFLGDSVGHATFVEKKVERWVSDVGCLAEISVTQRQAAFAALTKSLQCEWHYLQCVVPDCDALFVPLHQVLFDNFIPTLFGCDVNQPEWKLFALPVRFGGLGVFSPSLTAEPHYLASRASTEVLVSALQGDSFELATHEATVLSAKHDYASLGDAQFKQLFDDLLDQFDHIHQQVILRTHFNSLSGWLTVLPAEKDHFDLTTQEFRDALAVGY